MKILFASDFHLGATRQAGFTPESSARREAYSHELLAQILDGTPHDAAICCGDFFDKFTNPETVIERASGLAERFEFILPGNHDLSSRERVIGSLELMLGLRRRRLIPRSAALVYTEGSVKVWAVPHQLTQTLFLQELDAVCAKARAAPQAWKILLLHCNYASPFELSESSLHLTEERAHDLLSVFHYVFLGHEHRPADHCDGRLRVIGSHLPTTLDDFTDKRHLVFDTDTGDLASITHWSAAAHAYAGPAAGAPAGRQFYVLSECDDPKLPVRLFKDGAFGVRLLSGTKEQTAVVDRPRLHQLPQLIRDELQADRVLLDLWEELSV